MGQELIARSRSEPTGLWATRVMMDSPEIVRAIHDEYFEAGAAVATTNTYAVLRDRLAPYGIEDKFEALHIQGCEIAVAARDAAGHGQVAGSMGPTGWSYRPELAPPSAQAAELYAEIARIQAPYVDLYLCETMSSVDQARGAVMGASVVGKPVWLAISVMDEDGSKLRSGEPVADILPLLQEVNVAALLINCSQPESVDTGLPLIAGAGVRLGAYANGFTRIKESFSTDTPVNVLDHREDLDPERYARFARGWADAGATIIGGCCEIGPAHIRTLHAQFCGH